jgi:hypothetical protein
MKNKKLLHTYLVPVRLIPLRTYTHYLPVFAASEVEAYKLSIERLGTPYLTPRSFLKSPYQCFEKVLPIKSELFRKEDETSIISKALVVAHIEEYAECE